ncbi:MULTISPECIES: zinc-binding alcohol dehydrogenase family protein [Pseudomonas]|jgi:zinc-binding alcohol dehydrogenase family protein|uniref:zinc-binding alcohol dehydrogenase family protein n=1 Tax=Pseudomonas TaxID=286 RepID=UPI0006763BAC|nr:MULTISPECIES: zinc-binding alcohol dehydrogenase family protein [Pseudomonas]KNC17387.1 NADPH:quinone reductase [Pseudomonas sp. RIT-PI-a]KQQ59478.1 NADPH:quinone reductase [Pseudomonas sp. Leaf129]MBD8482455.1 zinc-binding alcohol dehydrogenase family protein [Pseudomonas coleopterorum]MDY1047445.1 zinc-binding alcohol dehydrogenase family protein [Pseudomonas coleopterorum]SEE78987.1 zinc-binding alcohol dehydrogenase family protein [Pseudomonas coleopterorum]
MKAIAYTQNGAASVLTDLQLPAPTPGPRDLLVQVQAISVNPVDTKVRSGAAVTEPRVLGWDAVGIVQQVGDQVSLFKVGDSVFYAGAIDRPGSNSELHLVDERIVGHKPQSLDNAHAAALPLTSITAWELLFDRLGVPEGGGEGQSLLIIGAAGGVGSILTQLARKLTKLTVIGTASRDETRQWVTDLGAHHVIDHSQPLVAQLEAIGVGQVDHVASLTHTDKHFEQLIEALRPQGQLALIDDPKTLDVMPMKRKALSLHWELMFTRSLFQTPDMIKQHELLERVAELIDSGVLRTTLGEHYGVINAANLIRAHELIESGTAKGKIVLEGF